MATQTFVRPPRPEITLEMLESAPTQIASLGLPEIDPDDPSLDDPAQCQRPPATFRELIFRHLPIEHATRGQRLCSCMYRWKWLFDGEHHWSQPLSACDLGILCPRCAVHQFWENFNHYSQLFTYVEAAAGFTRISFPTNLTEPKKAYNALTKTLKKRIGGKIPTLLKIHPLRQTIEVLCCGDLTSDALSALFLDRPEMKFLRLPPSSFHRELKAVLQPDIPAHPKEADLTAPETIALAKQIADLDTKFKGIRLLRVMGLTQEQRKELSTKSETAIVDNFHVNSAHPCGECGEPTLVKIPRCPKCRKLAIKFTKYGSEPVPPTDPEAWTDVVLWVPPPEPDEHSHG